MKKAVVTGADGFIGSRLVRKLLSEGFFVYCIGISEEKMGIKSNNLKFISLYFEEYKNIPSYINDECDYFFHLAWSGISGEYFKDYYKQMNNAIFACDAMAAAIKMNTKKFILASTVNVLEILDNYTDHMTYRFTNTYAAAKFSAELICKNMAIASNVEFNCGLISMVYGEGNLSRTVQNIAIKNMINNCPVKLVDGDLPFDLIHVDDVATAFLAIAKNGQNLKSYYIGHEKISTFKEVFNKIKEILNSDSEIIYGAYSSSSNIDYSHLDTSLLKTECKFIENDNFSKNITDTAKFLKDRDLIN